MKLNKCIYVAAIALAGSTFAQDQKGSAEDNRKLPGAGVPGKVDSTQPAVGADPSRTSVNDGIGTSLKELFMDWRVEDLPTAVQKTVQEQARGAKIKDIDRHDRKGQLSVWEIEFDQAGKDREIRIREDGSLVPENERGFRSATDGAVTALPGQNPGRGAAAGNQSGRSVNLGIGTQWEDLPLAVQQKAAQFGGKDKVADIDREEWNECVAYEIEFRRQGRNLELLFAEDGAVLESNDPKVAPAQPAARNIDAKGAVEQPVQTTVPGQSAPIGK